MALHNVPESDTFTTNVQMPADGDPADASDFEASSVKPLTDRTRWLKNKIDGLVAWITGGTVAPAGAVTVAADVTVQGFVAETVDADWLRGTRRERMAFPVGDTTYDGSSGVDVIVVDRSSLPDGLSIIEIDKTGFSLGSVVRVYITTFSISKDVRLRYLFDGSMVNINVADDKSGSYLFLLRNSTFGWYVIDSPG